jgi:ribosomal protein L21E
MAGGMSDRIGNNIRMFAHVKVTHPRHRYYGHTGTVVRMSERTRKVWVALPGGTIADAGHRSVEVIVPQTKR